MSRHFCLVGFAGLAALTLACASPPPPAPGPDAWSEEERNFYAMGVSIGVPLQDYTLSPEELARFVEGLEAAVQEQPLALEADPARIASLQQTLAARDLAAAEREREKSAPFVAAAAQEPGAVTRESGTVVISLEPGEGEKPTLDHYVRLHYHATLRDGSIWRSTRGGEPEHLIVGTTVRCWQEVLQEMGAGGRAVVVCPEQTAFGMQGVKRRIRGGAALRFEIDLVEVGERANVLTDDQL
ncbi:MAG: FKBP-type peptidyl-prolyl cis-trans isomerase [Myxococcota bacterium]